MPVPFAEISSDSPDIWNVQIGFWRDAVEHFDEMVKCSEDYEGDGRIATFVVDAAITLVLAGSSVSILLGQQWQVNRLREANENAKMVPAPKVLLERILNSVEQTKTTESADRLIEQFAEADKRYKAIRHFGDPKHATIRQITSETLTTDLSVYQTIWNVVIEWREVEAPYIPDDFNRKFEWPAPSNEF